jgi:hypothetical protein
MNRAIVLAGLVFALSSWLVLAQDDATLPKTITPAICVVRKVDKKKQEVTLVIMVGTPAQTDAKRDNLKPPDPPKMKLEAKEFAVPLFGFAIMTAEGKILHDDWDRLKTGQVILLSSDPKGIDPAYRSILARDTLILVPATQEAIGPENKETGPKEKKAKSKQEK